MNRPLEIMRDDLINGDVFYFKHDELYIYEVGYTTDEDGRTEVYQPGVEDTSSLSELRANTPVIVVHNTYGKRP